MVEHMKTSLCYLHTAANRQVQACRAAGGAVLHGDADVSRLDHRTGAQVFSANGMIRPVRALNTAAPVALQDVRPVGGKILLWFQLVSYTNCFQICFMNECDVESLPCVCVQHEISQDRRRNIWSWGLLLVMEYLSKGCNYFFHHCSHAAGHLNDTLKLIFVAWSSRKHADLSVKCCSSCWCLTHFYCCHLWCSKQPLVLVNAVKQRHNFNVCCFKGSFSICVRLLVLLGKCGFAVSVDHRPPYRRK